jgi:hypothetical protein
VPKDTFDPFFSKREAPDLSGEALYSALPDVYGPLHLISCKAQRTRLKSWRVGKIIENGFKRMNIKNQICLHHLQIYAIFSSNLPF